MDALNEDLLYTIFLHTLPSTFIYNVPPTGSPDTIQAISPLNLSLVCNSWRKLVHSSPSLWSNLHFELDDSHKKKDTTSEIFGRLLEHWLRRSSSSPLSISFTGSVGKDRTARKLLSLIIREQHRWKRISLAVQGSEDSNDTTNDAEPIPLHPFMLDCGPPLSSAELICTNLGNTFVNVDLSNATIGQPSNLEVLGLGHGTRLMLPKEIEKLHLPHLSQLYVYLDTASAVNETQHLLAASSSLTSLYLGINVHEPIERRSIMLPHLTDILINSHVASTDTSRELLGTLSCPSLLSLRVLATYQSEDVISPRIYRDFLLRSHKANPSSAKLPLVELVLVEDFLLGPTAPQPMDADAIADLLLHLISLEKLCISTHDATQLFKILSVPPNPKLKEIQEASESGACHSSRVVCPSLLEIYLESKDDLEGVDYNVILEEAVEMVVSRWRSKDTSLRRVSIEFSMQPSWSRNIRQDKRILDCVEEGLVLF